MDKVITSVLLTIAGVVAAAMLASALLPAVSSGIGTLAVTGAAVQDRVQTDFSVEYVAQNATASQLLIWLKNTGNNVIQPLNQVSLIITGTNTYLRPTQGGGAGQWTYTLDSTTWLPGTTCSVVVNNTTLSSGSYKVTVTTPNGITVSTSFNV